MSRRGRPGRVTTGLALLWLLAWTPPAAGQASHARVTLRPGRAKLGERVLYRAEVVHAPGDRVRWLPADSTLALTWGESRTGRKTAGGGGRASQRRTNDGPRAADTTWIEVPLQAFQLGAVPIPGRRFELRGAPPDSRPAFQRVPVARLVVVPVLAPGDSEAVLRPLRGPLAAPWWERVPWAQVLVAVVLAGAAVGLAVWLLRRRPRPSVAAPVAEIGPAEAALAALAALRALGLPQQGMFGDHAFRLGQILRRYLEATVLTTRPGDTTPELVAHLDQARIGPPDVGLLADLLRAWDRLKFARVAGTVEEAARAETAVAEYVGRSADRLERVA